MSLRNYRQFLAAAFGAGIDWSLTTWERNRREQLRRWAQLTLDEILQAQEEMAELAEDFGAAPLTPRAKDR